MQATTTLKRKDQTLIGRFRTVLIFTGIILMVIRPAVQAVEPEISVLEKDGRSLINPGPNPPYIGVLGEMGLNVQLSGGNDVYEIKRLDWEQLRRYNLLIVTDFSYLHGAGKVYDEEILADMLDRYMREGGAVFYIGQHKMNDYRHADDVNRWLDRYGLQIEWATIDDPEHAYDDIPKVPYQTEGVFRTTNISDHPAVGDGVETLFVRNRIFYSPFIRPLKVDKNWDVLVSTMPTAKVYDLTHPPGAGIPEKEEASVREGAFPLIAVRQVGKGRLAVFGSNPGHYWYDLGKSAGGQIAWKRGDGKTPSDWLPLLRNMALWLTEPARTAGFPDGAEDKVEFMFREDWGSRAPINWERPDLSWPDSELRRLWEVHSGFWTVEDWRAMMAGEYGSYRILVGARTAMSGGKGDVREWAEAAKAAGFDGIIFREDILNITREQWESFARECRDATDDTFIAVPGQQWSGWEGNQFMRFNREFIWKKDKDWYDDARLNPFGDGVREQLHWRIDVNPRPVSFPLTIKGNKTPYWSYRGYEALPVVVYENHRQVEDNFDEWKELVNRIEFLSPLAIHMLDDPAEIAATKDLFHLHLIAPDLRDVAENPRWGRGLGVGHPYCTVAYLSNGPIIESFQPINAFRTTLGAKGVDGSYRYRVVVRARSEVPITLVEVWDGKEILRRFRPEKKEFLKIFDDIHDRQRGIWLRIVDAEGKEAYTTSWNVHDKMLYLQWCGDHVNTLGGGCGITEDGSPSVFGKPTHVRKQYNMPTGPGAMQAEAWDFIPYGTDTAIPTLGLMGQLYLLTTDGRLPADNWVPIPNMIPWHIDRRVFVHRHKLNWVADRNYYMGADKRFGSNRFQGWGPYFTIHENKDFTAVIDNMDFHRDAGQMAVQLVRGAITFGRDVSFGEEKDNVNPISISLGRSGWWDNDGLYFPDGAATERGFRVIKRGEYMTFPQMLGNGTILPLREDIAFRYQIKDGAGTFWYGLALPGRSFKAGETLEFSFAVLRWPVGVPVEEKLDASFAAMLAPSGLHLEALRGGVSSADFGFSIKLDNGAFQGKLSSTDISCNIPLQVKGLNPNWMAALWRPGQKFLPPLAPDPNGIAWELVNPAEDKCEFFIGHVLTCDRKDVILRVMDRSDGNWQVLAHNPGESDANITVRGVSGGPLDGHVQKLDLKPGEEFIWTVEMK